MDTVAKALDFVGSIVSVTEAGVTDEDLSVATDLLVNVTGYLTEFQDTGGMILINEVTFIVIPMIHVCSRLNLYKGH